MYVLESKENYNNYKNGLASQSAEIFINNCIY